MNNKMTEKITPRDVDYAQWYTDVVKIARLCDYTDVKGCMIYLPNGQAIWENIQNNIDKMFKETGVQNVYLPMLIPESLLQKEKDHIAGFAPEVAWVTMGGNEELEERMCIRPTSVTIGKKKLNHIETYLKFIINGVLYLDGKKQLDHIFVVVNFYGKRVIQFTLLVKKLWKELYKCLMFIQHFVKII